MDEHLLVVESAFKFFPGKNALDGASFKLRAGEIGCILGPSGSGKTTLLRLVAGLERLSAGRLWMHGRLVDDGAAVFVPPERRRLGMVFQDYALWPHVTAVENVGLPLRERRVRDWRQRAADLLARVGLRGLERRYPHELSGGQQQRVALARTLAADATLLLLDEPLSNLDAALRDEMRGLIAEVIRAHDLTALYITHDQSEAFFLADRLGVLDEGRLLQVGAPEDVYERPAHPAVAEFTGAQGPFRARVANGRLLWAGAQIALPGDAAPREGPVEIYVRPHWLRPGAEEEGALRARVRACAYVGGGYEAVVDVEEITLRVRLDQRARVGQTLHLRCDGRRLIVFSGRDSRSGAPELEEESRRWSRLPRTSVS